MVESLVRRSSVGKNDLVLDIGAGKGIITSELLSKSAGVISIEIDAVLCEYLHTKFSRYHNFQLITTDFLQYNLPKHTYKVFANIPFSIEGKIIRKLLDAHNPPEDCYLVMRRDLAERLAGVRQEGQFSIFYKPYFIFEIIHYFKKTDFIPAARMDSVLFRFRKRTPTLLSKEDKKKYMLFVGQGFGGGKNLEYNLHIYFGHKQFTKLAERYSFSIHSKPSDLSLEQWIRLFTYTMAIGKF